jgi:purine-nucleoside phosphorylase
MLDLAAQIHEAVEAIRKSWAGRPRVGIILGTGLGGLAARVRTEASFDYQALPHFPSSTAAGHTGQLVCGALDTARNDRHGSPENATPSGTGPPGAPGERALTVVAMEGRFHAYEGYSYRQITFPVRVMKALGAELLIVSNAGGGLNPQYAHGDIMVIEDHVNLMNGNPLIGVNDDRLGVRFPDMSRPYDPTLIDRALQIARRENFVAHKGVYVAVTGPNLETRAEYRFLRSIGADVVGMSTVPEVIVAVHAGMRVLGLSIVTDMCLPDALKPADIDEILAIAAEAEPKMRKIVLGVLSQEPATA